MLKKILSVFFAASLLLSSNITSMAVDERIIVNSGKTEGGIESDLELNFIVPVTENNITTYYDKNNNVVDITSSNSFETVDEAALPETFDLRDEGRLTSVKDQGTEGFCFNGIN